MPATTPLIKPYGGIFALKVMILSLFCVLVVHLLLVSLMINHIISLPDLLSQVFSNYFPITAQSVDTTHNVPILLDFWQKYPDGVHVNSGKIADFFYLNITYAAVFGSLFLILWVVALFFLFKKNVNYIADCGPFREGVEKRLFMRGVILLIVVSLAMVWVNWHEVAKYKTLISQISIISDRYFYYYAVCFWAIIFFCCLSFYLFFCSILTGRGRHVVQ